MKARPILFSGPMIRALLDGRKTQTRRVMKPQPTVDQGWEEEPGWALFWKKHEDGFLPEELARLCPHGKRGDLLWVRETFAGFIQTNYEHDEWREAETEELRDHHPMTIEYRATSESVPNKWRPSLFMPRWASRLTLEITSVRVERLQDISEADAKAEGCDHNGSCDHARQRCEDIGCFGKDSYRGGFAELWWSINGSGSWDANPWVWVLEFEVHRCNVDALLKWRGA